LGSPAAKAGVEPWDIIVEINGVSCVNKPRSEIYNMLAGDPGEAVLFKFARLEKQWLTKIVRKPRAQVYGAEP